MTEKLAERTLELDCKKEENKMLKSEIMKKNF